jgi:hypothetical protein
MGRRIGGKKGKERHQQSDLKIKFGNKRQNKKKQTYLTFHHFCDILPCDDYTTLPPQCKLIRFNIQIYLSNTGFRYDYLGLFQQFICCLFLFFLFWHFFLPQNHRNVPRVTRSISVKRLLRFVFNH